MFFFSRGERVALAVLVAALVGAAGAMWWVGSRKSEPAAPFFTDAPTAARSADKITVHVCGEVAKPGLYKVAASSRIAEVLRLAGGTTKAADLDAVNLAAEAQDGQQVYVPARGAAAGESSARAGPNKPSAPASVRRERGALVRPAPPTARINVNTATAAQLDQLPGIGPAYARKIVEYRQRLKAETGQGFTRVEQLMEVPGIGPKRFADLKDHVGL